MSNEDFTEHGYYVQVRFYNEIGEFYRRFVAFSERELDDIFSRFGGKDNWTLVDVKQIPTFNRRKMPWYRRIFLRNFGR